MAGDTGAVKATRNNAATGGQRGTGGVHSSYAAAAKKSVESKRVGGGGVSSRDSRKSEIGSMSSITAQGAAAECQDLTIAANSPSAAVAQELGEGCWRVDRKRNSRARPVADNNMFSVLESVREQPTLEAATAEVAARDGEIERLQRVVADVREQAAARLVVVREEAAA